MCGQVPGGAREDREEVDGDLDEGPGLPAEDRWRRASFLAPILRRREATCN